MGRRRIRRTKVMPEELHSMIGQLYLASKNRGPCVHATLPPRLEFSFFSLVPYLFAGHVQHTFYGYFHVRFLLFGMVFQSHVFRAGAALRARARIKPICRLATLPPSRIGRKKKKSKKTVHAHPFVSWPSRLEIPLRRDSRSATCS